MADGFDPLIGKRIGAYKIKNEIGRGGMGAVYLATRDDGSFEQQVALKLIGAEWTQILFSAVFARLTRKVSGKNINWMLL